MKNKFNYVLLLVFFTPSLLYSQPEREHAVFFTTGKVYYMYEEPERNFSAGLTYQYRPFKAFSFDGFYSYSQTNSFPSFFEDKAKLHNYIMSLSARYFIAWSEIYTHSVGIRPHYSIINTNRWHLSLNFAFGVSFSRFSEQSSKRLTWSLITGQIIDYELHDHEKGSISGIFVSPGLQVHFNFYKDFIFGLNPHVHYFRPGADSEVLNSVPVWPEFINLSIMIGKKF